MIDMIANYSVLIVIAGIFLYFVFKYLKLDYKKKSEKKIKNIDLSKHDFFSKMKYHLDYTVPRMDMKSNAKNFYFKKMIGAMVVIWIEKMYEFIAIKDFFDCKDFEISVTKIFVQGMQNYQEEWERIGIPYLVISKLDRWQSPRIKLIKSDINAISHSIIYSSFKERKAAILQLFSISLELMLLDSEATLQELNSKIEKIYQEDINGFKNNVL